MTRDAYPSDQLAEAEINALADEEVEQIHEGTSDLKTASQSNKMIVGAPCRWKKTNELGFFLKAASESPRRIYSEGTWQTFIP
jgi:hypothetical protein